MANLDWPDCANARDLGGTRIGPDVVLGPGRLIRSDTLDRLTEAGRKSVLELPLSLVLDLRSDWDPGSSADHPFAHHAGYRAIPWIDAVRDLERDPAAEKDLAAIYCGSLDRNVLQIAKIMKVIAQAEPGTVIVHCHSGKDRTGLLVALLLDLLGAARDVITEDYLLSAVQLRRWHVERGTAAATGDRLDAESSTIPDTLDHLDVAYGGTRRYLVEQCQVSEDEVRRITERLRSP